MIVNLGIYIWVRVRGTLGDRGTKGYHMRIPLINNLWSPMPYPVGMIQALEMEISEDAQMPSIGVEPRK